MNWNYYGISTFVEFRNSLQHQTLLLPLRTVTNVEHATNGVGRHQEPVENCRCCHYSGSSVAQ